MFFKTKIISVNDVEKKKKLQDVFAKNNINYFLKTKPLNRPNAYDTAKLGPFANQKIQYMYTFYVDKKEKEIAELIVKKAFLYGDPN